MEREEAGEEREEAEEMEREESGKDAGNKPKEGRRRERKKHRGISITPVFD